MSTSPPSDVMTLAGLAQANGPWLAVRLRRLAEHAGQPLPEEIVEGAVLGSSRVLAQVLDAEGRPSVSPDLATDPAALLGREQAQAHRRAGMDMPGSVRTLRLMRRAYDDLVRESWVDKESRARAHEDVERFFERMLIGHFVDWAGGASAPPPPPLSPPQPDASKAEAERLAGLLAQREDELKRAMDAARQAASELRKSRERAAALATEIDQAQAWAKTQLEAQEALKAELAAAREQLSKAAAGSGDMAALKAEFAQAQAQSQARLEAMTAGARDLESRRADLEARLAEAQSALGAQREVEEARELALKEIDAARAEAEAAREALRKGLEGVQEAVARAEGQTLLARREAEIAQDELRAAREEHATLASEAEAMRARLSETGSRMAEARKTEEEDLQVRLTQTASALKQAEARIGALEAKLREAGQSRQGLAERLAEQESLHGFKDERMREQSRAIAETQELLVRLGATKDEIVSRAQNAEAELERLRKAHEALGAEREQLRVELAAARKKVKLLGVSREELAALNSELERVRAELAAAAGARDETAREAQALRAERDDLATRLLVAGNSLEQTARQAQAAADERDAGARLLSTHLAQTSDAVAAVDASGAVTAWSKRFRDCFGLVEADQGTGLAGLLPRMAERLQGPQPWLARMRELLADPNLSEDGLTLASTTGETLVFRSHPAEAGTGGRLFQFRDVSLEHDMERLVREIENITRYELGQSLTAFIHLPQELLDDPAVSPQQAEKLTVIRDSGYRIVNTVNMAVDIFRMERGLYKPPLGRALDLAVVARRAAKDVGQLAASRHVALELLLDGAPLPAAAKLSGPGDPIPAHALVLNLLRDALEGAPRQSGVRAALGADEAARQLCLDITRPGVLNMEEQARYFAKPLGASPDNGLARARYAARIIAESLGGSVRVSASPETGTTLSLRLPKD